jgi:hypothetical protein
MAKFNDEILDKCLNYCLTQKRVTYALSEFRLEIDKTNSLLDSLNNARVLFKIYNFEEIAIAIQVCIYFFYK